MKKQNLIIIDDDKITHFILSKMFLRNSFFSKPIAFLSALEALDFLTKSNVADDSYYLIFLDINMPVMNGWEFLEKLKSTLPVNPTYVAVISSSTDESDIQKAFDNPHVISYLTKPVSNQSLEELIQKVASILNK
ncbi:MAG: response regulator [Flavobacterium sp.]|jgi:CheY-like chemotaxis protein|nr:response regulator [Flavobacterium sp.]